MFGQRKLELVGEGRGARCVEDGLRTDAESKPRVDVARLQVGLQREHDVWVGATGAHALVRIRQAFNADPTDS